MQRVQHSPHVVQVADHGHGIGEVSLEPGAVTVTEPSLEVVGDELDELRAHTAVVAMAAASSEPRRPSASTSGASAVRTLARARCRSTRWLPSLIFEQRAHVVGLQPDEIAQRDHHALGRREPLDGL